MGRNESKRRSIGDVVTAPRIILDGETIFVTRRCAGRQFRLRPDPATSHIIRYCIGYAAARHHILLHEVVVMSNHYHMILTDLARRRAKFFGEVNSLIARAVNAEYGDWENLFATGSYNCVKLLSGKDVADKAAYTLLNPTAAGLVREPEDWGGVTSHSMVYGRPIVIPKPKAFFTEEMPESVELRLIRPTAMFPHLDDNDARGRLRLRVRDAAGEFAESLRRMGGRFMGMDRVRAQPRHSAPHTRAPRRGIRPTVASKDTKARVGALKARRKFLSAYESARRSWEAGDRAVVFPRGTYLMRERFRVTVEKN